MKTPEEIKKGLERCGNSGECKDCAYFHGTAMCISELAEDALAYIQQLEQRLVEVNKTLPRWISVNDRLPERGITRCIIAIKLGNGLKGTLCARYNADLKSWSGWYNDRITSEVTHWMPLPQPPKEDV